MSNLVLDRAGLTGQAKNAELMPTREDLRGKKGFKEWWDRKGVRHWKYSFKPNDGRGNLTKESQMVGEMIAPSARAEDERHRKLQAKVNKVPLMVGGVTNYVTEDLADAQARKHGWGRRPTFGYSRAFSEAPFWER